MSGAIKLRIGTSERDGTFWSQGQALAGLLRRDPEIEVSVLDANQASIENARRLDVGLIDFGFMASNWIGRAKNGNPPFDDKIALRMAAPANSGAMFFIVRADSPLRSVRDMVGRRIAIGPEGSGMVQHIHTIFGVLGIGIDDFTPAYLSFEEGARALEAGEVDAQWQCPYPNVVMRELSERADIRVLDQDPADLARVFEAVDFYRPSVMPAGLFRGVDADTRQLAVVNVIATHERTDAETVRRLVATMIADADALAEANPLYTGLAELFERARVRRRAAASGCPAGLSRRGLSLLTASPRGATIKHRTTP